MSSTSYEALFNRFKSTFDLNYSGTNWPSESMYSNYTEKVWRGQNGWVHTQEVYFDGHLIDRYEVSAKKGPSIIAENHCTPTTFGTYSCKPYFYLDQTKLASGDDNLRGACDDSISEITLCVSGNHKQDAYTFLTGVRTFIPDVKVGVRFCYSTGDSIECEAPSPR